jgi:2-keto-4-pentenoate hydratase/2-oxohepta-3-ene-1,7-dioic acid hydratase in catechol pathway
MRLATISWEGTDQAAVRVDERWVPLHLLDGHLKGDLLVLIRRQLAVDELADLQAMAGTLASRMTASADKVVFRPPFRHPRLIWGIGLNYAEHASDLNERQPADPASFIKGNHTIIGHGDVVHLPSLSTRVTTEAEVAIILAREVRDVREEEALDVVFGITPVLDQTAEDILEENPRYLTRSKNFETFFAFGPEVVTLDSIEGELADLNVSTVINGQTVRTNCVGNMLHSPQQLVAFHTAHMPMFAGDLISTGTPGAGVISPGDRIEARIEQLAPLAVTVAAEP